MRTEETPPRHRVQFRFGIGTASALAKLVIAAALLGLLVYGFHSRWNALLLVGLGMPLALVVGGLIIAPLLSSLFADSLGQFSRTRAPTEEEEEIDRSSWAGATPPTYPSARRLAPGWHLSSNEEAITRPLSVRLAAGYDWPGFVADMAARLEVVLGAGFRADCDGTVMTLHQGDSLRKVELKTIFDPPPLDMSERAMRGALKMMDEAQMFAMRVTATPWPCRQGRDEASFSDLPRPRVRIDRGELRMVWSDSNGVVLKLDPLPLDFVG